ncbi:hypothetical protein DXG01_002986 [Tephrocybe rancida]|nr:hypothetical protein DXG01_002986 [Tephrocybe rancida]
MSDLPGDKDLLQRWASTNNSAVTPSAHPRTTTLATPIFPFSRPYSLPTAQPSPGLPKSPPPPQQEEPLPDSATHWTDRFSSASLPLPANVPFHTLPRAPAQPPPLTEREPYRESEWDREREVREREAAGDAHAARVRQAHRSEVGSSPRPPHYPYAHAPPPPPESESSGSGSGSGESSARHSPAEEEAPGPDAQLQHQQHPPQLRRRRSSGGSGSGSPPPPPRADSPPRRPATSPQYHHFSPAPPPFPPNTSPAAAAYPAPDPPTILAPTVSPAPFLSHAPPPPDSWIEVETSAGEYRLVVRLPGFRRDGITLATKRRRVLHVVADSWEGGGGHFERRISFGYDADLVQVRAEFDGEMLRISVPRRLPPVDLWAPMRPGPIGRAG